MLWSLLKIVAFITIIAALTYGATYLLEADGGLQIVAMGQEFTLGPLQSVIAIVLFAVAVYVLFKLVSFLVATLRFINGDETAISRYFDRNRERKGYQALSEGLVALASGEGRLAIAKAERAEKYLQKPEVTDLVVAQAAEMNGDRDKAERVYKRLVQNEDTRFVGVRGLMRQKLERGETDVALKLAEKAFAIKPKHEEVQDTLLKLQAGSADWKGARQTLDAKLKYGALPRDVHKRRDAVLALSQARAILDDGNDIEARERAIEAAKKSPDLVPAVAMAARAYVAQGKQKYATRLIKKAWQTQPHPDLAAAFAEIEPNETPAQRLQRFELLARQNPTAAETKLVMAELNLAAEDFPAARRALGDLIETRPDARVMTIMAAIERGEGAPDNVVNGWLTRALSAPRGPQWVCENCNHIQANWAAVCSNCGAVDSLSWTSPPEDQTVLPGSAEMLPLLVRDDAGSKDDAAVVTVDDTVETPPISDTVPEAEVVSPSDARQPEQTR